MPTKTQKDTAAKAPTVNVVLSTFDYCAGAPTYRRLRGGPITEFGPVGASEYCPRGSTPLRDASALFCADLADASTPDSVTVGLLLDESSSMSGNREAVIQGVNEFVAGLRETAADPEAAGKVLAVISTDGEENASRETSPEALRSIFEAREADGWTFIFLGADRNAWDEGTSYGLSGTASGQTVSSVNTPKGTAAAFREAGSRGVGYVSENAAFTRRYAGAMANTMLSEDGDLTEAETGAPDPVAAAKVQAKISERGNAALAKSLEGSPYDPAAALEKAASATRSPGAS